MPFKKQNKRKKTNVKQEKKIKSRLMEISIRLDNYIYKKKTIEVQEAEILIKEINDYRTPCKNDDRSLQVIEKLTRHMKNIIEEIVEKHNVSTNLNKPTQNTNFKELVQEDSIDMFSEHSVNDEPHKIINDNKENCDMLPESSNNNDKIDSLDKIYTALNSNNNNIVSFNSNNIEQIPIIVIDSDDDAEQYDTPLENDFQNKSVNFNKPFNIVTPIKSITTKGNMNIDNTLKITEKEQHECNFTSKSSTEKDTLLCNRKDSSTSSNTKRDYINISSSAVEYLNISKNNNDLNMNGQPRETKPLKSIKNNKNFIPPLKAHHTNNSNIEKKNTGKAFKSIIDKESSISQDLTQNISNISMEPKPVAEKRKRKKPNKDSNNKIKKSVKGHKKTTSKNPQATSNPPMDRESSPSLLQNSLSYIEPNKYKHTCIDVVSDEVSLPASLNEPYEIKNKASEISKQMDALKINDCFESDISWIRNIKYVREVSNDEFDQRLSNLDEAFWDDLTLPSHLNNMDFFY